MIRKSAFSATAVVLLAVGAVSCSTDEPAKPEPTESTSQPARPVTGTVTRDQGATQYLELVAPYNREIDKCVPTLNRMLEGEDLSPKDFEGLRSDCKNMPKANRTFGDELSKAKWPEEVQESIKMLVDEARADQLAWQGIAEARTPDDLFNPQYPLAENGTAADLVRAHLGLPPTEEVE